MVNKKALVLATVCSVSVAIFILRIFVERELPPKIFEEIDEIVLTVDENGDVNGWARLSLSKSELADFMKIFVLNVGKDVLQKEYKSNWKSSFAMLGTEISSIDVKIENVEDFSILIEWKSPQVARWEDNRWVIEMAWVDPESAASEVLGGILTSWLTVASIAKEYSYKSVIMRVRSTMKIILPEWAENIWSNAFENPEYVEYGRGSYSRGQFQLDWENGRPVIVENSILVLDSRHTINLKVENILENHVPLVITYSGVRPFENFERLLSKIRLDLKFGRSKNVYSFLYENSVWSLSLEQILHNVSLLILENENFVPSPLPVDLEGEEIGDWNALFTELSMRDAVALAQQIVENVRKYGSIPASTWTAWGRMRYRDILYSMLRLLERNEPIIFLPVPDGKLLWNGEMVSAKLAYYLLPNSYVLTKTRRVYQILENIWNHDRLRLAEEICNWTGTNIVYSLSFRPPTSEEVLETKRGQCRDYSNVYLAIARTAGLPSRRVSGWVESEWIPPAGWGFGSTTTPEGRKVILHAWVQVFLPDKGWLDIEPQSARPELYVGKLPYRVYVKLEQSWTEAIADYESAWGSI